MGSKLHSVVAALALLFCLCAVGSVPGSSSRAMLIAYEPPALPKSARGDVSVDVRVVNTATGADASGAIVTAVSVVKGIAYLAASAASGPDGRVTLSGLPRAETWLIAEAPGLARASTHCVAGDTREVTLELARERRLEVLVQDDLGKPLVSAEIEVAGAEPLPVGARTGRDGTASVGRLAQAPWIVTIRADGYETVTRRGVREGERLVLTLRRLATIQVTVVGVGDSPAATTVLLAGSEVWPARSGQADAHGHLRLGGLSSGSYALRAIAGDLVSAIEVGVSLGRGEEKEVSLTLVRGRFVSVRAMDGDGPDAAPIASARVTLVEGGLSPFPLEETTDRDGRARLGPIAPGPAYVSARAEGFVPRGLTEVPDDGGALALVLVRAGTLTGRVIDARGFPIDGASVEIVGTDAAGSPIDDDPRRSELRDAHFDAALPGPRPLIPSGELGVVPGPVPPIPHSFSAPVASSGSASLAEPWVTRSDGTFRATPASPGRVRALVRHPQFVEGLSDAVTLAPAGTAFVEITLASGGSLEGRVTDARGQPSSRARVTVTAVRGSLERSTFTATDGSFAFASVPAAVTITAYGEGSNLAVHASANVPEGGRQFVTLKLPEARPPLAVRVVDDRGYPLDAVQLSASSLDPAFPLRTTAFTNVRGEASVQDGSGIDLRIEARAPGHAPKAVRVSAGAASLDLVLEMAQSIVGEVRSTRGDPIADAEITIPIEGGAVHARTDRDGAFRVSDLPAGSLHLIARHAGFAPADEEMTIAAADHGRVTLPSIELPIEGVVEGVVTDLRGAPVAGARVAKDRVPTYLAVGALPRGIAVTDSRGRFRLGELPAGSLRLEAYAPDSGSGSAEGVDVSAGRTTAGVELRLKRDGETLAQEPASSGGVAVTLGEAGDPKEVVLVDVAGGSEAERAGLAVGDVILEIDGTPVHTIASARARLAGPTSDDVVVTFMRGPEREALRIPREAVRK